MNKELLDLIYAYVKKDAPLGFAFLFAIVGIYLITLDTDRQVIAGVIVLFLSVSLTVLRMRKNIDKAVACKEEKELNGSN